MKHAHRWLVILVVVLLVVVVLLGMTASPNAEATQPLVPTGVSGYEVFPGIHKARSSVTSGASFGGWTNAPLAKAWVPRSRSTGGYWGVTVNYRGTPGLGRSVTILPDGYWFLQGGGAALAGEVQSGVVVWPANLETDIGCGAGVATVVAALAIAGGGSLALNGCLNDTHLSTVFPPEVWGNVTTNN
jgi:hypothetical protein